MRKNEKIILDPVQNFYYESDSTPLIWDNFAFTRPGKGRNENCAMVGYLVEGKDWNSASCENTAGDIICQELPKKI